MTIKDYAYYYSLRNESRQRIAASINKKAIQSKRLTEWKLVTLSSIDKAAIDYARLEWTKFYSKETHMGFEYSWEKLIHRFSARPSFFDLAIWQQIGELRVLQGMALGRPSNAKKHLTINWIERSFQPTYLKPGILAVVLGCAEEYAKLVGCRKVLIKSPVDPLSYERYGYAQYKHPQVRGTYVCKELAHEHSI